jgi:hypothetical protein
MRANTFLRLVPIILLVGCYGDAVIQVVGQVIDERGQPVGKANVHLTPDPSFYPNAKPVSVQTLDDGQFSLLLTLPPKGKGLAVLKVEAHGFEEFQAEYGNGTHFNELIRLRPRDNEQGRRGR